MSWIYKKGAIKCNEATMFFSTESSGSSGVSNWEKVQTFILISRYTKYKSQVYHSDKYESKIIKILKMTKGNVFMNLR